MVVEIRSNLTRIGTTLRAQILDRVEGAVSHTRASVLRVHVGLSDENGPRGGVDKRCRIHVHGAHGDVVVEERNESLEGAVHLATQRLKRALRKNLGRRTATSPSPLRHAHGLA